MSAKLVERVKFGKRGDGCLVLYSNSKNWVSAYHRRGREHRESTGTPDVKAARRFHKAKLDALAADRQGLRVHVAPLARRVTVDQILDDYMADLGLRGAKSLAKLVSAAKPVRTHFGAKPAGEVTTALVDA